MKIEVKHLARIEGHANLLIDAEKGELVECRLEVVESPRFFEPLLRGRHYSDVAPIVARICGVCSNSHTLASLSATEAALGVEVSEQTRGLRRLLAYGEILQSHLLQLYFMAVPDYLGVSSIFPLAKSRREVVSRALRLKKLANDVCAVVGGRPVHPVTPCVGGFAALPNAADLQALRRRLVGALPDLEATIDLFASFSFPDFARETEYLCLRGDDGYPVMGETIVSTDGLCAPVATYATVIEEYLVPHSTAKFARASRSSYMVGPLARVKNAFASLSPMARQVATAMGLDPSAVNPYLSLVARLVEVVHCVEEAIHLIDRLLSVGLGGEAIAVPQGGGQGAAAIEAPRGALFHSYTYDEKGCIESADCIIPTAQNLGNIEADLRELVPTLLDLPREELSLRLEQLVRAYDPCISCSTHLLRVAFV
jgi:coenzyme F420-reducing hydrogenase alpha subunit